MTTEATTPVKTVWVHPKTYEMLLAFGLLQADKGLPFLHDGRYVAVHAMMPSKGLYDRPVPKLEEALLARNEAETAGQGAA